MIKTCIIIEDQPPAQRILQKYIADVDSLQLKAVFSDALSAIPYIQEHRIDLIFLDIHLPKISGMDFLKTLSNSPQVILTTAFSDYALESYEFNVVDYLLKPFSFQRFVQAVSKATLTTTTVNNVVNTPSPKGNAFFIKSGYDLIKIISEEIIYIHSDADYTEIVTEDKKHLSPDSLKDWLQKLNSSFIQVHKSFVINSNKISKISGNQVFLENDYKVPIGRVYKGFIKDL